MNGRPDGSEGFLGQREVLKGKTKSDLSHMGVKSPARKNEL